MEFTTNTIGGIIFQSILLKQEDAPDDFAIKMLTNNEIAGLLKLSVLRKNSDLEIRYNVTSLIPLSQVMDSPLSKSKVLAILKSIVSAAREVEEYMLDPTGIILDRDKIYVDITNGNSGVMYVPCFAHEGIDVVSFIKDLLTRFQFDQTDDSSYVLRFMNAFNNRTIVTITDLYEFICSVERDGSKSSKPATEVKKEKKENLDRSQIMKPGGYEREKPLNNTFNTPPVMQEEKKVAIVEPVVPSKIQEKEEPAKKKNLFAKSTPEKKEKPKSKLFGKKAETSSESIPGLGFAVPGMDNNVEVKNSQPAVPPMQAMPSAPVASAVPAGQDKQVETPKEKQSNYAYDNSKPSKPLDYGSTIMVNQNNTISTVMLDDSDYEMQGNLAASVTRASNNQKMYVDKDVLKMGKESDYVDFYIGNNPTISRSHADIIRKDGMYYVRDNNAKNHTYVNGEMIMPGQLVQLNNNDEIMLSNELFIFKLS